MIIFASSSSREASILSTLCDFRRWPCHTCASVADFLPLAQRVQPRAVVVRHQLEDGYSDDILAHLGDQSLANRPRALVLMAANCTIAAEARQIELGADIVLRDPVRIPVMLEYLARFRSHPSKGPTSAAIPVSWQFAGVEVFPLEHRISANGQDVHLAPQEVALVQILHRQPGRVVTYPVLYGELFNQRFAGETANSRVLLVKATASFRKLGVDLRSHIKVIPKSGYLYTASAPPPAGASIDHQSGGIKAQSLSPRKVRNRKKDNG